MIASPHENYKVLAKAPTRRVYVRATISGSSSQSVTSDDKIISFTIDKGAQSGGMSIGNAYCAKLTMKLIDTQVSPGDVVQLMNSFRFPDGSVVASNFLGFFTVQTVSRKGRTTTLTAYDNIIKMSKDYKSKLAYPATLEAVLNEVCGSGMTIDPNIVIPQYIVTEKPIKGINSEGKTLFYTKRQMLGFIASLLGGNFYLGSGNNILYLTKYSAAAESMEAANTISADFSGYSFSVTDVVYSEDGISISRDDEKDSAGVLEFECPLKLVTAPSAIAETIKAALSSFQYEGAALTRQGYGLYELGELVTAYDSEGTAHTILISGIKQKFENGSFVEKYYSCAESSEEQNYNSGDITGQTVPQSVSDHGTVNSPLTEYKYLTDLSVKFNGTTYTAEKDGATGLISRISDDAGNEFEPTISSGITDVVMHNAAFLAVAMLSGLGESTIMPVTAGLVGYFDYKRQCAPALWTNRLGGDNIPITGSAAVNAECLKMPNGTRGTFSMPYTDGAMTFYAVLKCSDKSGTGSWDLNYVLGAGSMSQHGGMRCLCEYNGTWLFANSGNAYDIVPEISAVDDYHVIAVTCDASQNEVMYIDGVSVGSKSLPKVSYGGIWGINHLNNNGVVQEPSVLTCNLKMLAFGRTAHTAEQIATNAAWLKKYYGL